MISVIKATAKDNRSIVAIGKVAVEEALRIEKNRQQRAFFVFLAGAKGARRLEQGVGKFGLGQLLQVKTGDNVGHGAP